MRRGKRRRGDGEKAKELGGGGGGRKEEEGWRWGEKGDWPPASALPCPGCGTPGRPWRLSFPVCNPSLPLSLPPAGPAMDVLYL